jgi:hypothetical protein
VSSSAYLSPFSDRSLSKMSLSKKRTLYEKKRRLRFAESISDLERVLHEIGIPAERLHSQLDILAEANFLLGRAKDSLSSFVDDREPIRAKGTLKSHAIEDYRRQEYDQVERTSQVSREVFILFCDSLHSF